MYSRILVRLAAPLILTLLFPVSVGFDWPTALFRRRVWHIGRPAPERAALARAVEVIRSARGWVRGSRSRPTWVRLRVRGPLSIPDRRKTQTAEPRQVFGHTIG